MRPASVDDIVGRIRVEEESIRFWIGCQRFWHEADLSVWLYASLKVRIEDLINDCPVVDRIAVGILGIGIRATPFKAWSRIVWRVAGGQEIMRAEVRLVSSKLAQFCKKCFAVRRCCFVRFLMVSVFVDIPIWRPHISAKEASDRWQLAEGGRGVNSDLHLTSKSSCAE